MMGFKRPWQSKTYGLNLLSFIALWLLKKYYPDYEAVVCGHADIALAVAGYFALMNMGIRNKTKDKICMRNPNKLLSILVLLALIGCAGMDIEIRPDPHPSPLDKNYHNLLMKSSCESGYSVGQAGCSVEEGEDLSKKTIQILTPLGGSVQVYSRECSVDRKDFIPKGQILSYSLKELVPAGAQFCTFSIYTYWEKPASIQTEVPVRGQSGKFYVRVRPKGRAAAKMAWTPQQGVIKQNEGVIYSQFRATERNEHREPVLLEIAAQSFPGMFQLWSEPKQIGLKSTNYNSSNIQVNRDKIVPNQKTGSYILAGWILPDDHVNVEDMVVAIDVFGQDVSKLSGSLNFNAKQVCFETENTVSLVVLSGVEKASNEVKGCFPKPTGDQVMAFFTNVGRAAYAFISGDKYVWIQ